MQILQGMPILGFFDESLATMQRKFILYHENILGCQRNNPRGNVLPSLRSGGLFYPRCARVKQLPPFSSIGKNNFPPLVFLRLPKFFHNTRTFIPGGSATEDGGKWNLKTTFQNIFDFLVLFIRLYLGMSIQEALKTWRWRLLKNLKTPFFSRYSKFLLIGNWYWSKTSPKFFLQKNSNKYGR